MTTGVKITSLAFPTRDRPRSLVRCLESYRQNVEGNGHSVQLLVFDDSPDETVRLETRSAIASLRTARTSIFYAGLEEKRAFASALQRESQAPASAIEFALFDPLGCGMTTGANRNAILLHSAGQAFFCADDDTLCRLAEPLDLEAGLKFSSSSNPTDLWAFPDWQTARQAVRWVDKDILQLHEMLLGKNVDHCMDACPQGDPDIKDVSPSFAKKLMSDEARVRIAWMGIFGDSGFRYPTYLWSLNKRARRDFVQSEPHFRSVCRSRVILRAPRSLTIGGESGFFQSTALSFDNRDLLPPFPPVCRGQDGIFGQLFMTCFGQDFVAYLPWAIAHEPEPVRENKEDDIERGGTTVQFHNVLRSVIGRFGPSKELSSPSENLKALGAYLINTASRPQREFDEWMRPPITASREKMMKDLQHSLRANHGTPRYWAARLNARLKRLKDAEARADFLVPEDLALGRTSDEARALAQRLVGRFGELLMAWPDLVAAAKRLRAKGLHLAQEVRL